MVLEGQFVSQASCYLARHSVGRNKGFFTQIELFNHHHRVVLRELAQDTMAAAQAELCSGEWDFLDTIKKIASGSKWRCLQSSQPGEILHFEPCG